MKKIYALIASVALGGMINASAQYYFEAPQKTPGEPKQIEGNLFKTIAPKTSTKALKAPARAEEGSVDLTTFTQWQYYDYFWNWNDYPAKSQDGTERSSSREIMSSQEISYEIDGNEIIIDNLFGFSNETCENNANFQDYNAPRMYVNDEGKLMLKLGKWFYYKANKYTYVLAAILDEDGDNVAEAEYYDGEVELQVYLNGWVFPDFLGIAIVDSNNSVLGFTDLAVYNLALLPNAVLEYDNTMYTSAGEPVVTNVSNSVYVRYTEADPENPDDYDRLSISNIVYYNAGTEVEFGILNDYAAANNQIASRSEYTSNQYYSGDFYFWGFDPATNKITDTLVEGSFTDLGNEKYELTWDGETFIYSESGYWCGWQSPGTLTINFNSGINSAIADDAASNGPTEYYNLQGVKVANPTAGQIYIVKEGSKVSKQIIR